MSFNLRDLPLPLLPGRVHVGNCLDLLQRMGDKSVQTCITSPPYFGLRDYGHADQIGAEPTPDEFVATLVRVFREVRRVLRDDGTLWLNLGDSYASDTKWGGQTSGKHVRPLRGDTGIGRNRTNTGLKDKDLIGIPWKVAFALQADGWYLRQDIIWAKPNPMPESVRDRCTKSHEYLFLLSKSRRYYFDADAIAEPLAAASIERLSQPTLDQQAGSERVPGKTNDAIKAVRPRASGTQHKQIACGNNQGGYLGSNDQYEKRNKRSVWTVTTRPFKGAHFATFPEALITPCILAGAPVGGLVLDPFMGAGTTGLVARKNGRNWIGCELNPDYAEMAMGRIYESP